MRGFLNVGMVCQVISLERTLFYVCMTIVNEFGRIYGSNGSVTGAGNLFDLDIV